jgi:hypothetical protein
MTLYLKTPFSSAGKSGNSLKRKSSLSSLSNFAVQTCPYAPKKIAVAVEESGHGRPQP